MDHDERPSQASGKDSGASEIGGRRKFLRQFGVAAAATAGLAGLAGLKPASASAAVKGRTAASLPYLGIAPQKIVRPVRAGQEATPDCNGIAGSCSCSPGHCAGGPCPPGYWCNRCWGAGTKTCFGRSGYFCVLGGCLHAPHLAGLCTLC